MKEMKIIGCIILTIGFFQCASVHFEKTPPFSVKGATFNNYVGGLPGVSGTWVRIYYEATTKIAFDSIFFKGRKTKIELQTIKNKTFASGHFNTSTVNSKEDLILHREGKKEYGNKAPEKKLPFELKENEAVISYTENGETKYYKVKNIKEGKKTYYP